MIDISNQIDIKNLTAEEIDIILSGISGTSSINPDEPNVVSYGGNFRVLYKSKDRKVLKISVDNKYWKIDKDKIIGEFHNASNPTSDKIYTKAIYSSGQELSTYPFRWRDQFQLGRPPEGESKPKELSALYPCLFQYKVPFTGNLRLDVHRSGKYFEKYFLPLIPILRQYCTTHLQYDSNKSSRKSWAIINNENEISSEWVQLDYFFKSRFSTSDFFEYNQPSLKKLPCFELDHYWLSSRDLSVGYFAYESLPEEKKRKFLLGCEWFNKAIMTPEPTDKFLFIMIMLEIFLPNESTPCKECRQPIYGINKKFKIYIPEIIGESWTPDFEKVLGNLYSLRSGIAHSGVAIAQSHGGLIPVQIKERNQLDYLLSLGRQFLISWLSVMYEQQKQAGEDSLI